MSRRIPPPNKNQVIFDTKFVVIPTSMTKLIRENVTQTERPGDYIAVITCILDFYQMEGLVPTIPQLQILTGYGKGKIHKIRRILAQCNIISVLISRNKKTGKIIGKKTFINFNHTHGNPYYGATGDISVLRTNNTIPNPSGLGVCGECKEKTKKKKPLDERPKDFEKFYATYPRKVDRKETKKIWSQKIRDKTLPSLSILLNAISQELDHDWKDIEQKYIPHPSRWLRGERWTDYEDTTSIDDTEDLLEFVISMAEVTKREAHRYLEWLKTQDKKMLFGDKEILPPTGRYWKRWSKKYNK